MAATITTHAVLRSVPFAAQRASPVPSRRAAHLSPPRAAPGGDGKGEVLGEDLLARLKVAEAEAQRLKAELAAAQEGKGTAAAPAAEEKKGKRIDGGDLRRETLFTTESRGRNWLNESDVNFFTGGGPSEAEGGAAESAEADGTVRRRLLLGLVLGAAGAGLSLVPTEDLAFAPTKPLFFYIIPLLRSQMLLARVEEVLPEGDYPQLKALLARILGEPNNVQSNLRDAASLLPKAKIPEAVELARDVYEYLREIDYNQYFDSVSRPGMAGGVAEAQFLDFSTKSAAAAAGKLRQFLALMPAEQLEAAQQQLATTPF